MHIRNSALVILVCLLLSVTAVAQKNELAVTAGGQFPNNSDFNSGASWAIGANFAHLIIHAALVSLYWEIAVVGAP